MIKQRTMGRTGLKLSYLRDPDGNGLELYWDRPREEWPRDADGALAMVTEALDLESLLAAR